MMKQWTLMGLLLSALTLTGCGGESESLKVESVVPVKGTVQMDGNPMAEGEISFATAGGGPAIIKIQNGQFEGKVSPGEKRVEIKAFKPGQPIMMDGKPTGDPVPENYIPARFNSESTFTAKIEETGAEGLKFEVQSK